MDAFGDPQILNSQLQTILDTANKTFSVDQVQLLAREIQQTTAGAPSAGSSNQRKRKANRCDGTNCGPPSPPMKRRMKAPGVEIPTELQAGRFMCACSQWVSLRDESGFTLAPWVAHLLVCGQSKVTGSASKESTSDQTLSDSILRGDSKSRSSADQLFPGHETHEMSLVSTGARSDDYSSRESSPPRAESTMESEKVLLDSPSAERTSRTDELRQEDTPSQVAVSGITTMHSNKELRVKEGLPKALLWDTSPPKQRRPNRTEAERIQELHADPQVAEVEPYRVLCAVCNKWIKLRNNSRYCSIPWRCHKTCCGRINGSSSSASGQSPVASTSANLDSPIQDSSPSSRQSSAFNASLPHSFLATNARPPHVHPGVPPPNVHPSLQLHTATLPPSSIRLNSPSVTSASGTSRVPTKEPRRARLLDAEQRRAALLADPHTEIVEPDRILCSLCKKWVKLRPNSTYCSAPWHSHIQRCVTRTKKRASTTGEPMLGKSSTAPDTGDGLICGHSPPAGKDGPIPNKNSIKPKGSYYRDTYEGSGDPRPGDDQVRPSYYKSSATPVPQDPSTFAMPMPKRRRGRPPKQRFPEIKPKLPENGADSEVSYESEEE